MRTASLVWPSVPVCSASPIMCVCVCQYVGLSVAPTVAHVCVPLCLRVPHGENVVFDCFGMLCSVRFSLLLCSTTVISYSDSIAQRMQCRVNAVWCKETDSASVKSVAFCPIFYLFIYFCNLLVGVRGNVAMWQVGKETGSRPPNELKSTKVLEMQQQTW